MANQGEAASSPAVGEKGKAAQAVQNTQKTAPVAQKEAPKNLIPLTKQNLEKWIKENKGLDYISEVTGATRYFVKKSLREYGLKTPKMMSVNPVTTRDQLTVHDLIENGAQSIDDLVEAGMSEEVAKVTVRKMLNERTIKMVLANVPLIEQSNSFEE